MAWTTPRTWVVGELVTAALLNAHVRDNFAWLADRIGTASGGAATFSKQYITIAGSEVVATGSTGILLVAFGVTFADLPVIVVCNGDANIAAADDMALHVRNTTGFSAQCGANSTNVRVNWIAVGELA